MKLIESEKVGMFANASILVADDGTTALEILRQEINEGRAVHYILMDFIMVIRADFLPFPFGLIYVPTVPAVIVSCCSQTKMHGPDAARIMRDDLNYHGIIIGDYYSYFYYLASIDMIIIVCI